MGQNPIQRGSRAKNQFRNGDSDKEIISISSTGLIYVWNKNGNLLPGYPQNVSTETEEDVFVYPFLSVDDIDLDGKLELLYISVIRNNPTLYLSLKEFTNGSLVDFESQMFQHDARHTGCYNCDNLWQNEPMHKLIMSLPIQQRKKCLGLFSYHTSSNPA